MKNNDKKLQKLMDISFRYAYYHTGNYDTARDISSQVISKYLLSFEKSNQKEEGWIINTTKNYLMKEFEDKSKEQKKVTSYGKSMLDDFSSIEFSKDEYSLRDAFREAYESLDKNDLQIILYYFQSGRKIKNIHENLGMSYDSLRKRISLIKKKLKAETYRNLGLIGTKKIVTPKLNDLIVKFLKRFKHHLESRTLEKMYYYFSEIDLKNYNPSYEIKDILDYDVELNDYIYKVYVIYLNKEEEHDMFIIEFYIDSNNHLKIVIPPKKPKKIMKIDKKTSDGKKISDLLNSYQIDETGRPNIPPEELEKIIQEFEAKKDADISNQEKE